MRWDGGFVAPMLAEQGREPFDDPGWRFELKWDGWRALVGRTSRFSVWSRRGRDLLSTFPELTALEAALSPSCLLDGELVSLGPDGRPDFLGLRRKHPPALRYVAFDVLALDGELLIERPLIERLQALPVAYHTHRTALSNLLNPALQEKGQMFHQAARELGFEGVIAKRLSAPYHPGRRSTAWLKFPLWTRMTLEIRDIRARKDGVSLSLAEPGGGPVGQVDAPYPPPAGVDRVLVATRGRTPSGHLRHPRVLGYGGEENP